MNQNAVDVARAFKAHERPSRPTVQTLEHAPATGAVAGIALPGADPNQVWVEGTQRDGADALGGLIVKDGVPGDAGTGAFPKPA